jgi:hypothetical protein
MAAEREEHRKELERDVTDAFEAMFTRQKMMYRRRTLPVVEVKSETKDDEQL